MSDVHPLTRYRKREGLTKAALAARLGVSRASVTRYEAGQREIDRELIPQFAGVTGIPEAVLAGYQDWSEGEAAA